MLAKPKLSSALLALCATMSACMAADPSGVTETTSPTPADLRQPVFPPSQEENATLIVAKNALIFEGKSTTWADLAEELERRAGTKGGDLATVNYYRTYGTYQDELRSQEAENWSQMLTDTSGVRVQQAGIILNHAAEHYDALQFTDQWPPGSANPVRGRVVDVDENPIADAQVVLLPPAPSTSRFGGPHHINLRDGQVREETDHLVTRTDENGHFEFDFPTKDTSVLVAAPQGFALVAATSSAAAIKLTPWARVTMKIPQNKKLGDQTASLTVFVKPTGGRSDVYINLSQGSPNIAQEDFEFVAVPALHRIQAFRTLWNEDENGALLGRPQGQPYKFTSEPGTTHHLEFERIEKAEP